jgi:hypothetical protein
MTTANEVGVYAVVYLSRSSSTAGGLVKLPKGTATMRSREELYSAGEIRANHEKILEILSDIPTYELQYSEFDQGIRRLELLLEEILENPQSADDYTSNLADSSLKP